MELPKLSKERVHDNAYVWLFMKGDFYLPGIFTSVYSVLRTNPNADLVVMVTSDVSEEARSVLLKVATHLCYIDYITVESKQMKTERQRKIYSTWVSSSYSKWNVLALPYKKIVLIDGDTIHTDNTDELFAMQAPAMPIASPYVKPMGTIDSYYPGPVALDGYPLHGAIIPIETSMQSLNKNGLVNTATAAVIEPNIEDYHAYLNMLKEMQPFGFPACHSAFDEQSIVYFYTNKKKVPITAVHQMYNYYPWKPGFLFPGVVPKIIHYFSDTKPWTMAFDKYPDLITWYTMAAAAIDHTKIKPADINLTDKNVKSVKGAEDTFINKFIKTTNVLDIYELCRF